MEFAFQEKPFHHKYALSLDGVSFAYTPDKPLIDELNFQVKGHDRVMVIGRNGRGKTTLLKVMAGFLEPQAGSLTYSKSVTAGYYEQSYAEEMNNENTVLEEIALANPQLEPARVRQIAGTLMFEGDEALKPIKVLSGGEKSRVLLGKILARPVNLLLLDEPTNHLDLESSDALLAALANFDGAVVIVTHNEMFLRALADRLVVFQDNKIEVFEGDYESFLEKVGWSEERLEREARTRLPEKNLESISESDRHYGLPADEVLKPAAAPDELPFRFKLSPRELRKLRSEVIIEKSRSLKPLEERVQQLENNIEETEERIGQLTQQIIEASVAGLGQEVVRLSRELDLDRHNLESLYEEYTQVYQEYEDKRQIFERRLEELDKISS